MNCHDPHALSSSAEAAITSVWARPLRGLTLGLTLVVLAGAFEALAVATIMPATVRELAGMQLYGWAFSGFTLTNLIGISVSGSESTKVGAIPLFLSGVAVFCLGLAVAALASSMAVVVLGRLLQGFGSGVLYTIAYSAISRAYPVALRPRMLATLSSAWVIPGLVGPGLAGLVATATSWRWVFGGLLPLPLVAAALVVPALREHPSTTPPSSQPGKVLHALQLSIGTGFVLQALGHPASWLALPAGLFGSVASGHALRGLLPRGTLLAREGQPAAIATMALITFAFFGSEAFVPLALSHVRAVPTALTGLPLTAASLTWTLGAWLPVRVAGRVSRRALVLGGLACLALGIAGTTLVLLPYVPTVSVYATWAIAGLGMGIAFTATSAAILDAPEADGSAQASASLQLAQALGAAWATGIGGAIVAAPFAGDPPRLGIALVDGLMVLCLGAGAWAARGIHGRA